MPSLEVSPLSEPLFDARFIPAVALPPNYTLRPIQADDYQRGVLDVLRVLTTVGNISEARFAQQMAYWQKHNETYFNVVICNEADRVVAVGSVVVERKLIHECGLVGHIEDIAVAADQQGKKLGLRLIQALTEIARLQGAYKVILDCSEHNVSFYEKCGYEKVGVEMSLKFQEQKKAHI